MTENILAWLEANQNADLEKFLANLKIVCFTTKYNENEINIELPGGLNFEWAKITNHGETLAQYKRIKPLCEGFLERVKLMFELHNGDTNTHLQELIAEKKAENQ